MLNLDKFPMDPGVYLMKDASGKILYIGKAKHLKQRIKHYFLPGGDGREMIPFLVAQIASIDTIVVSTEKEALLLENTLIKKHQPKYNAFLKDDKTFISLMVNNKHKWPMIRLVRYKGKPKDNGLYFGPYTSAYAARQTFELLIRLFPLRQCSDDELKRRTRPCLLYGMKKCIAPCVNLCTKQEYDTFVDGAVKFLKGQDKEIVKTLKIEMQKASDNLEFEKAASLLQTIQQIEEVLDSHQIVAKPSGKDTDVFAIYREANEVMLVQLLFRNGTLVGSEHYSFSEVAQDDQELLESFLVQLYKDQQELPHELLVPVALTPAVTEILPLSIHVPQKGEKKELLELAQKNAKAIFQKEKDASELKEKMLIDLQETLHLNRFPERIECFDTSNISGTDLVASMVAFTDGEKDRKRTRLYKIRDIDKSDDYAALRQVLSRRLMRAKQEDDLPDLVIVDGGKGQLNIALDVFKELDIATVDVISLAKQDARHDKGMTQERVFVPHQSEPIILPLRSPILFLLQKIRDETHDKAIGFHRKRRSKRTITSLLDDIPGIGPTKRTRLLTHFGSLHKLKEASEEQWKQVKGITDKDVKALKAFFK